MGDSENFLGSKPILAYQLDATHLQNVLQRLAKNQDALLTDNQNSRERNRDLGRAVQELGDRVGRIEGALNNLGGADDVRNLKNQLVDVSRVVDGITQQALPDMQRKVDNAENAVDKAARSAVQHAMEPLEKRSQDVLDQTRKEMGQAVQEQKNLSNQLARDRQQLEDKFRNQGLGQQEQLKDSVRELGQRVDNVERNVVEPLRDAVNEMQQTTNANFQQIENATRLFDGEINKLKAEMANLRSDLNAFENNVSNNVAKIREDLDTKFQMLVQMMQSFERNNQIFENAVAEAGAKLGRARDTATTGGLNSFMANSSQPKSSAAGGGGLPASNVNRSSASTPMSGTRY